jgi:hypothetical protein
MWIDLIVICKYRPGHATVPLTDITASTYDKICNCSFKNLQEKAPANQGWTSCDKTTYFFKESKTNIVNSLFITDSDRICQKFRDLKAFHVTFKVAHWALSWNCPLLSDYISLLCCFKFDAFVFILVVSTSRVKITCSVQQQHGTSRVEGGVIHLLVSWDWDIFWVLMREKASHINYRATALNMKWHAIISNLKFSIKSDRNFTKNVSACTITDYVNIRVTG